MSADPPRRPPGPPPGLFRSKSYNGPPRRKRGREVLEDITWIVNDPSSWLHDVQRGREAGGVVGLGIAEAAQEARADGQAIPAPSQRAARPQEDAEDEQPPAASTSSRPSLSLRPASTLSRPDMRGLPALYGAPRLTNLDYSSSPPSSPRLSAFGLGMPSGSGSGSSSARSLSPSPSLSLRAPPLSRRNSASSLNSDGINAGGSGMRRTRTHTGIRSALPSPTLLQAPSTDAQRVFGAGPNGGSGSASSTPNLPTIAQSPERKKTRRYEAGDQDTDTEVDEDDDREDADDAGPLL